VELAAELYDFVNEDVATWYGVEIAKRIRIVLLEAGTTILGSFDAALANHTANLFRSRNIDVRTGVRIKQVHRNGWEMFLRTLFDSSM
jgi:NADH dehydrogenase